MEAEAAGQEDKRRGSLDTRLNTFGFLYIACSLIMHAVFTTESSLVLNFHTRCLFLVA